MKKNLFILFSVFLSAFIISCEPDREDYDELSNNAQVGGLLDVSTRLVGYVVGNSGPYSVSFEVFPSKVETLSVDVYVTYNRSTDGVVSNRKLLRTITSPLRYNTFTVTFEELIDGLLVNGQPLSTSDTDLNIGDYFELDYLSHIEGSIEHQNVATTKVSVGTRFAGKYRCVEGAYYRLGVLTYETGDWPEVTVIESVDATTYKVNEYFGPFEGNEFYFQIDGNNIISYPPTTPDGSAQLGNNNPMITCETNPSDMTNVNCGNSNYVVLDDVFGKDKLYMSFGYYTSGSGSREFYQVMEKIVE